MKKVSLALTLGILALTFFGWKYKTDSTVSVLPATTAVAVTPPSSSALLTSTRNLHTLWGEGEQKSGKRHYSFISTHPETFLTLEKGERFHWEVAPKFTYQGTIVHKSEHGSTTNLTVRLDEEEGKLLFQKNRKRTNIKVFYNGKGRAHQFLHEDGQWTAIETNISGLQCADLSSTHPVTNAFIKAKVKSSKSTPTATAQPTFPTTPNFESRTNAPTVIYLDFDGEVVNDGRWDDNTITAAPSGLSARNVYAVMCAVAEDFSPFNVNVTNNRTVFNNTPSDQRVMCITSPTDTAAPGNGGVAYGSSFEDDDVCWNFITGTEHGISDIADTISHEVGHTIGLDHDGGYVRDPSQVTSADATSFASDSEYYGGHINGSEAWAPIMGSGYGYPLSQWSRGEYFRAVQYDYNEDDNGVRTYFTIPFQDDFQVVTENGLALLADDYGNNIATAHPITSTGNLTTISGTIGANSDIDAFQINYTGLGLLNIEAGSTEISSNLDIKARLYDANETLLIEAAPTNLRTAQIQRELQPGTYYLLLEGDGTGAPNSSTVSGYSKYGSVGNYTVRLTSTPHETQDAVELSTPVISTGPVPWQSQTNIAHDSADALQASRTGHDQSSTFSFTSKTRNISFWYKVSSETEGDSLVFSIDGEEEESWDGEIAWTQHTVTNLEDSEHTFTFSYTRDDSGSAGLNTAWIDQIQVDDTSTLATYLQQLGITGNGLTDTDGDGSVDIMEYASSANANSSASSPTYRLEDTLIFERDRTRKDLTIRLLISEDLNSWETAAVSYGGNAFFERNGTTLITESGSDTASRISVNLKGSQPTRFARFEFESY